jgi:hypothetical protein
MMTANVVASHDAVFNHLVEGNDGNTGGDTPSTCRLYLQATGDNLSGQGAYEYYRWWARANGMVLKDGTFTTIVALNPENWADVWGRPGDESVATQAGFAHALANVEFIGFTCGGGYSFGHGVNMESGRATFTVTIFSVI